MEASPLLPGSIHRAIAARTGLNIGEGDQGRLLEAIRRRKDALRVSSDRYCDLLLAGGSQAEQEWKQLIPLLTTGETFFLRDKGQMSLLRDRILPELIERRRGQRELRLWSAGCSTGEEAYTLGMLIDQVLPDRDDWNIQIYGTDINPDALVRARQGIYTDWSFRLVEPGVRERYFRRHAAGWEIHPSIRRLVRFAYGSLVADPFPDPATGFCDFDLILCRNVFIYFNPDAVALVLDKFARSLRDGGYLMSGHAEIPFGMPLPLQVRSFPEATLYQFTAEPVANSRPPAQPAEAPASRSRVEPVAFTAANRPVQEKPAVRHAPADALDEAARLIQQGDCFSVINRLQQILRADPKNGPAHALLAEAYANLGRYDEAEESCKNALLHDPFAVPPYFLLAQIAQVHRHDMAGARQHLQRILYLMPTCAAAHLELAGIFELEGDPARALKLRLIALDLLRALPPDELVMPYRDITAADLIRELSGMTEADLNGGEPIAVSGT